MPCGRTPSLRAARTAGLQLASNVFPADGLYVESALRAGGTAATTTRVVLPAGQCAERGLAGKAVASAYMQRPMRAYK